MRLLGDEDDNPTTRTAHTGPRFSREEGREIFREMVRGETRNGPLTERRRRRLIQYAAALDLRPLEASRIVTEVCQEQTLPDSPPPLYRLVETAADVRRWPTWLTIALTLLAAFAVDRIVRLLI